MSQTHIWKEPAAAGRLGIGDVRTAISKSELAKLRRLEGVRFVHPSHKELARAFDERGILWKYKPRTFAVEWDDDGNFLDSFTPDFYLPALDLYIELADHESDAASVRAIRLLRQAHPSIRIDLLTSCHYSDLAIFSQPIGQRSKLS